MKRTAAWLLVLVLLLGLCACTNTNQPTQTEAPTTANPTNPTEANPTEPTADKWAEYEIITIAKALELCGEPGNLTTDRYYIRGTIVSIDNANYGKMTIQDETGTIAVYGTYSADGSINYAEMEQKPYKGDEVLLHCTLQNYNGTKEVKNARLIDFVKVEVEIDESAYTASTIAAARLAEVGAKVKVTGVVAKINHANGMIPTGIFLVDNTGAIYVYDSDLAARVKVGNQITILASKDYWILDSEKDMAAKFGYKGSNQLTEVTLVSNDEGNHEFDKSWITEKTVKEILDTPVTEDITTTIFKVNALVKKAPGNGFTNYYINDLDGTTGSYVYTQCNGSDYSWLDEFDGKICTVYLAVQNAKSTSAGCVYRFTPVLVKDEGFDAAVVDAAKHAVQYTGIPQFQLSYTGNPALKLATSASSDLLGFENVVLSYASSDSSVISVDGNVMNCLKTGKATITVTGTYGGKTYSESVEITVTITQVTVQYATVADAIAAALGNTVTVKGIVGPSLVNKTGFYLIDKSGVIAVETTEDVMATLQPGHEVVLEAVRGFNNKDGSQYGQTCLKDAKVITNNYGEHAYATDSFKGNITVADFYNLDINKDFTTSVYTMKATVLLEETAYYTNIYLTDGTTKVRLYCSSGNQYGFLKAYAGQEITVEIAACNWNSKNYYTGCVLAVVNADGTKDINKLNFSK